ncbi:MAG: alkaline phosphatase family protein [Pseudomonadales bacterium]
MSSGTPSFLIVGFDALRPEMITEENMPNLYRFSNKGVTFENHRCCYPSETYVNLPSLVTGSTPSRHGMMANSYLDKNVDSRERFEGHNLARIEKAQKAYQGKLYDVPSFGELLHAHGKRMAVISTNSAGSVRLKHYSVKDHPHLSLSCHTPETSWPLEAVQAIQEKCGAPPQTKVIPDLAGVTYATDVFLKHVVSEGVPELTILWYGEPDESYHSFGLGSEQSLSALRHADAEFGRILSWWENSDMHENLQIVVTSDHAQITKKTPISMFDLLTGEGFKVDDHLEDGAEIALISGYSGNMLLKNSDSGLANAVGEALMGFDCCGMVFSHDRDGVEGIIPGSFSKKLVMVDHARSPDIYFALKTDNEANENGLKGNCYFDGQLPAGGGVHGGLHPNEVHCTCIIQGSLFREHTNISTTSGITDIFPTILHGLNIPVPKSVDGRILFESMVSKSDFSPEQVSTSFEVGQRNFQQILKTTRVGGSIYLDGGWRTR